MRSKLMNPVTLLLLFSVACAFTLGGAPPSASDEGALAGTYEEIAASEVLPYSGYAMAVGLVPVSLQVQLFEVAANSSDSEKAYYKRIGGVPQSSLLSLKSLVPSASGKTVTTPQKPAVPKKPYLVHKVQNGETLYDIADRYNVNVDTLVNVNMLGNINRLKVGQLLNIITVDGLLYTVKKGESLWDIAKRYKVDIKKIVSVNNLGSPDSLQPKQMIVLPGAKPIEQPKVVKRSAPTSSKSTVSSSAPKSTAVVSTRGKLQRAFNWPVRGRLSSRFGSRWGRMHEGLDIGVSSGTPVRAATSGRVTFSGWGGAYGYLVKIDHGNGVETRYAHNSRLLVKVGQHVSSGQVLARSGNTGRSTGPHVHFEIRRNGRPYNPLSYLR